MIEIRTNHHTGDHSWDQYVLSRDQGGPYLGSAWRNAIEKAYGHRTFYLAAYNGPQVVGILPMVRIRHPLIRKRLVSLPFCDYGGILADNDSAAEAILTRAIELSHEMGALLEIRSPGSCLAVEKNAGFVQVTDKCRMILDLPGNAVLLWSGFKSKLRSQVKKASRDGLVARLGREPLLDDFYRVFSRNMRDLGSPVHSRKWIKSIVSAFNGNVRVGVVYKDALPVGAGIILTHGNIVTIPYASTRKEFNRFSPNMLLYWTFLEYAADHGYRFFDFGRSTPGEGTYAFKKQWGAGPFPLYWYRYSDKGVFMNTDSRNGALRHAAEKIWHRLPLAVANGLGPHLRKYIDR